MRQNVINTKIDSQALEWYFMQYQPFSVYEVVRKYLLIRLSDDDRNHWSVM
ncbi:hypothetical protein GLIP_3812 [Aliiglaciecola lipolytica E3]|uniref:Uncharacterized protein n=1 Tax=Aliiglaciecola lipolytica E3 TaxID=1127673 RepID=K6YIJ4_9ALTE|nr:hypothetical protein GLIP_3812 [Aliiglaciecola lipolytica E3]